MPWVGAIAAGGPLGPAFVALGILTSAETYRDFISQEYATALVRAPNSPGLDEWVAALLNREITTGQAAALILGSDEASLHALGQ